MKCLSTRLFTLALVLLVSALPVRAENQRSDFSNAQLDQMLAPIALYPDTVLSHILIAATYPLEVVQADRWARAHPGLEGESAVNAADQEDWEPSVKALVAFPHILQRLSDDLAWTQQVGDAFLDDEAAVMDAIQRLRRKAYDAGTLDKLEHVRVQQDREVIVIEPAVERVVYVPVYDTRVVYGHWGWVDYPPVYWHYPSSHTFVHGFYWGPRIYVGPSFYFSSFHWHRRHVVYVDYRRYHQRPHFYTGRSIVSYRDASHWRHNPTHRRGVAYHNERVSRHYGSNRTNYTAAHQNRGTQPRWQRNEGQANVNRPPRNEQNRYREADRVRQQLGSGQSNQENRYWRQRDGEGSSNREGQRVNPGSGENRGDRTQRTNDARQQAERYTGDTRPGNREAPTNTTRPSTQDPRRTVPADTSAPRQEAPRDAAPAGESSARTRYLSTERNTTTRTEASPRREVNTTRDSGRTESRINRDNRQISRPSNDNRGSSRTERTGR